MFMIVSHIQVGSAATVLLGSFIFIFTCWSCSCQCQGVLWMILPRLRLFYEGFSTSISFIVYVIDQLPAPSRRHTLKHQNPHPHLHPRHHHQQACGCVQAGWQSIRIRIGGIGIAIRIIANKRPGRADKINNNASGTYSFTVTGLDRWSVVGKDV